MTILILELLCWIGALAGGFELYTRWQRRKLVKRIWRRLEEADVWGRNKELRNG